MQIMHEKYFSTRSRAYYRHYAMTKNHKPEAAYTTTMPAIEAPPRRPSLDGTTVMKVTDTGDGIDEERQLRSVMIGFESARYAFLENCGMATLVVVRTGPTHLKAAIAYKTR